MPNLKDEIEQGGGATIILLNPSDLKTGATISFREQQFGKIVRRGKIKIEQIKFDNPVKSKKNRLNIQGLK